MNIDPPGRDVPAGSPRFSVIMVFHDARRYLEDAVVSVRAQTFTDWELVLVDDGSGDGSREIAESLAAADTGRIRLFEHAGRRNLGISASRNLGVSRARGELLAFLDADDVYLPDRLARHVELLDRYPEVALVQSRIEFWHSWQANEAGIREDRPEPVSPLPSGRPLEPPHLLVLLLRSRGFTVPAVCSLTIRTRRGAARGRIRGVVPGRVRDQVLLAKLYSQCRTLVIDDVLARYRQHPGSVVHRPRARRNLRSRLAEPGRARIPGMAAAIRRRDSLRQPAAARRAASSATAVPAPLGVATDAPAGAVVARGAQGGAARAAVDAAGSDPRVCGGARRRVRRRAAPALRGGASSTR